MNDGFVAQYVLRGGDAAKLKDEINAIVANPAAFVDDPLRGEFAKELISTLRRSSLRSSLFSPDNPHPASGYPLPLPRARDSGRGGEETFPRRASPQRLTVV